MSMSINRKRIEIRKLVSLEVALNIHEKGFTIPKTISDCKKWNIWNIFVSKLLIILSPGKIFVLLFRTKWAVPHQIKPGILKLTIRRVRSNFRIAFIFVGCEKKKWNIWNIFVSKLLIILSPGKILVLLFRTKWAVPHQIKPGILKLTIRRVRSNFRIAFIFVGCEDKDFYRFAFIRTAWFSLPLVLQVQPPYARRESSQGKLASSENDLHFLVWPSHENCYKNVNINNFNSTDLSRMQDACYIWTQLNDLAFHEFS